jgi:hypothetical protein
MKERAKFKTVHCSAHDECDLYKNNQCSMFDMFAEKCPYGNISVQTGYTKRASKYSEWIRQKKEIVKDVKQLSNSSSRLFICKDYVFFNFPHWYLSFKDTEYEGSFFKDISYIKVKDFTIDFVYKIVTCRPNAMFGGEITSYQKDVVPSMLLALQSSMTEFTNELIDKYPDVKTRIQNISFIGKEVLAYTLKEGCEYYFDRYGKAFWDGEYFTFQNYNSAFKAIDGEVSARIKPDKKAKVKIQSNDQVNANTVFI